MTWGDLRGASREEAVAIVAMLKNDPYYEDYKRYVIDTHDDFQIDDGFELDWKDRRRVVFKSKWHGEIFTKTWAQMRSLKVQAECSALLGKGDACDDAWLRRVSHDMANDLRISSATVRFQPQPTKMVNRRYISSIVYNHMDFPHKSPPPEGFIDALIDLYHLERSK